MVGILASFWDGLFSGAMLVSGGVVFIHAEHAEPCNSLPRFQCPPKPRHYPTPLVAMATCTEHRIPSYQIRLQQPAVHPGGL